MKIEDHKRAIKIRSRRSDLKSELKLWENEITGKNKLAYLQAWNGFHATKLDTNISDELFNGFRMAAINDLKNKIHAAETEFNKI